MTKRNRVVLSDNAKYVIYVIWLYGFSLQQVAQASARFSGEDVTKDRAWGVIKNSPFRWRSKMTINERQEHLDVLKSDRMDDGRIKDRMFVAVPFADGRKK